MMHPVIIRTLLVFLTSSIFTFKALSNNSTIEKPSPFTIMAVSGLKLRTAPSLDSKVLKTLPFGTTVYSHFYLISGLETNSQYPRDTISGVIGYWVNVNYKEQKLKGYVFSPYLYPGELINTVIDTPATRIIHEGINCGKIGYHPGLNWYGLYKEEGGFLLKKIKISLILSSVNPHKEFEEMEVDQQLTLLKTNEKERSLFLIGTATKMKTGEINTFFHAEDKGFSVNEKNGFLYPEQKMEFEYDFRDYEIKAFERITSGSGMKLNRKYQLQISARAFGNVDSEANISNISEELALCCSADEHVKYQTPQIDWVGDINQDGLLDVVFYQHSMSEGCGVEWTSSLFLSALNEKGVQEFRLVDQEIDYSCM